MQHDIAGPFRKSTYSGPTNDCVEVAPTSTHAGAAIRDGKDHSAGTLRTGSASWSALIAGLKR